MDHLGSNTIYATVRVSAMRAVALFSDVFISSHFSIITESTKLHYTLFQGGAGLRINNFSDGK